MKRLTQLPPVKFKQLPWYGETRGKTIILDRAKFKGVEGLDSVLHEKNHIVDMGASESAIIKKTKKEVNSLLAII
jgi:hypothetical protein